jgi:hypothetical protein
LVREWGGGGRRGEEEGREESCFDLTIEILRPTYFGFGNNIDCGGTELQKSMTRPSTLIGAVIGQKNKIKNR